MANGNVVHESEAQRQHVRVRLPGIIEFNAGKDHCRCKLVDVSAGGFCFESQNRAFRPGETYRGSLVLNVDSIAIALSVTFQVRNHDARNGRTGCQFQELGPREISALRHLITSFLSGELISVGDVLHTLGRDNFTKARPSAAGARAAARDGDGRRGGMLMTVLILAAGVLAFGYTAKQVNQLLFVSSATAAKVAGPVYTIAMPREGTFHSLVPDDGIVKKGAPLASFEAPVLDLLRSQASSANLSADQLQKMLGTTVKGTITSPCDCRVQTQFVASAQYVPRGQPLFELMPREFKPYLVARFRYDQIDDLAQGGVVHFRVNGDSEERRGKITQVRAPGQGDVVESDVLVFVQPDEPLPAELLARPAEVTAGGLNPIPRALMALAPERANADQ